MKQTHARVTKPNTIQNPFREYQATKFQCLMRCRLSLGDPDIADATAKINFRIYTESSLTNRYGTQQSRMRLVVGGATTFKREGNDHSGIKNNSIANNQQTGSAGTMHREAHSPIEMANRDKRTTRTIDKLDSKNGDKCTQTSHSKHTLR